MSAKVVIFHLMIVLYIKISASYLHKMRILKNKKSHLEDATFRISRNKPVLLAQKAQQHAGSDGGANDSGYVWPHGVHE